MTENQAEFDDVTMAYDQTPGDDIFEQQHRSFAPSSLPIRSRTYVAPSAGTSSPDFMTPPTTSTHSFSCPQTQILDEACYPLSQIYDDKSDTPTEMAPNIRPDDYRDNLRHNDIVFEGDGPESERPFPPAVSSVVSSIKTIAKQRPNMNKAVREAFNEPEFVSMIHTAQESMVTHMLSSHFIPNSITENRDLIAIRLRIPLSRAYVPQKIGAPPLTLPTPNLAFGYTLQRQSVSEEEYAFLTSRPIGRRGYVTTDRLFFPFLLIECKSNTPSGGGSDMFSAGNQVAGGAATCCRALQSLLDQVAEKGASRRPPSVDRAIWALIIDNARAVLFVSSLADEKCRLRVVATFELHSARGYVGLKGTLEKIFHWGRGARLDSIHACIEYIMRD